MAAMIKKRIVPIIVCLIEFIVFSLASLTLFLMLFHAAILGLPVVACMWSFWWMDLFWAITLIKIKIRHKLQIAGFALFYVYDAISSLICVSVVSASMDTTAATFLIVNGALTVIVTILAFFSIKNILKIYIPLIKEKHINPKLKT